MMIRIESHRVPQANWLRLTRRSSQNQTSPQWPRAILWQKTIYPYEGTPSEEQTSFLLFFPENTQELCLALREACVVQGGREESEWASLAMVCRELGGDEATIMAFFQENLPLLREDPSLWAWMCTQSDLIKRAAWYGISFRLLVEWRNDTPWMRWLGQAMESLEAHGNQLRQVRQGFLSLMNGRRWSLEKVLEEVDWESIRKIEDSPAKRLEILMSRLKTLRYPAYTTAEGRLKTLSLAIRNKTGWHMTWPPFLEGEALTLHIPLKKTDDITSLGSQALRIASEVEEALHLLHGEKP